MTVSDPIADLLTRIRNAQMARHPMVTLPSSNIKAAVARILKDEGFIEDYNVARETAQGTLRLRLKYLPDRKPAISGLERVSRPGRRVYTGAQEVPWVLSGMGVAVISTSQGIMTDRQARRSRIGGEVLCYVW